MFNSYGAMNEILDFFEPLDVLKFQILSRWMYVRGVCRCQMTFRLLSKTFYYTSKTKFDKNKIYCYETRHERLHTLENPSSRQELYCNHCFHSASVPRCE